MPSRTKAVAAAEPLTEPVDSAQARAEALGTADPDLGLRLVQQISETLNIPAGIAKKDLRLRTRAALAAIRAIKPGDGVESMLASQMVATHEAAMKWLARAERSGQNLEGADLCLRQANKLLALYLKQLTTLERKRNKGRQKVTVEHVHVDSGGQAVVGVFEQHTHKK